MVGFRLYLLWALSLVFGEWFLLVVWVPRGMEALFEPEGPDVEYRVRLAAPHMAREPGVRAVA
jgi:hypothetical protein